MRGFSRAEDEVALHLMELGVVWVSHPNNSALAGMDTADGADLYPAPVWDVRRAFHEGIAPPPPSSCFAAPASFPPPLYLRLTWECQVGAQLGLKRLIWG